MEYPVDVAVAPVDNLRAAYVFLAQAVRDDPGSRVLTERLQVCDIALEHGPQVFGHYQAGRCLWCGQRPPEPGRFMCEECSADPSLSALDTRRANYSSYDQAIESGWRPPAENGAAVRYFRQVAPKNTTEPGAGYYVYQVDTTRPEEDQVYVIHEGEWTVTEYENLARFLGNTKRFSPGTVSEITAEEAAAAHPARTTELPPVTDDDL